MISQKVVVINPTGLHARPAAQFVTEAKKFKSDLKINKNNKRINGKSIIQIMSAGISAGTEIFLEADGPDEEAAVKVLSELIRSGFGEV